MPKQRSKEEMRLYQEERRKRVTPSVTPDVTPSDVLPFVTPSDVTPSETASDVTPDVTPFLPPEWAHVAEFISRPLAPGQTLANLEKLKWLAGALGKYADDVWFGGLTMGEIGRVLGTEKPELGKKRPY